MSRPVVEGLLAALWLAMAVYAAWSSAAWPALIFALNAGLQLSDFARALREARS